MVFLGGCYVAALNVRPKKIYAVSLKKRAEKKERRERKKEHKIRLC